jgi:hypothetical protein
MEKLLVKSKKLEISSMLHPDEIRTFENRKLEIVNIGGAAVGKATFMPGWKWSKSVKPLVKTKSCEAPHFQYQISGVLHVKMDGGEEKDIKAGEVCIVPPGHDAWVVGNEPVVAIDFQGMQDYAKKR